ncbi:MAG: hypothetical protein AB8F95_10200 [Bacteroidia bacterium]
MSFWDKIVNLVDYTPAEIIWFGIGCYMWAMVYIVVIRNIIKKKEVDIPWLAICFNIAWETYWGLGLLHRDTVGDPVTKSDMGPLFTWAYLIWFFLDLYIVYSMFRYGWKQQLTKQGEKHHVAIAGISMAAFFALLYFFIPEYDDQIGAFSGWTANVLMSLAFVVQKFKQPSFCTSRLVAIFKFIGTGTCSYIVWSHADLSQMETLKAMTVIFALLDLFFIYQVFTGPKHVKQEVAHG